MGRESRDGRRSSTLLETPLDPLTTTPQSGHSQTSTPPATTRPWGPRNWKLVLSYDGSDYCGWQIQPGQPTIQGELQAALGRVVGETPLPQGSGRTDAGVHALAQVASFALRAPIPADSLQCALNRTLPSAIRVREANKVRSDFHARHSAVAKTYEYRVYLERPPHSLSRTMDCPPFLARYVYSYPWPLDFEALQASARLFIGMHDFLSFAATDPDRAARSGPNPAASTVADEEDSGQPGATRTIFSSSWECQPIEDTVLFVYRVRGSGFLHHMVRNLVGTMLDVGRGYRRAEEIPVMIAARSRTAAGPTAPARGLFLHSVEYPPET